MKLHLYHLNKKEAFLLSKEALSQLGFTIHLADERNGIITSSRQVSKEMDILFFNVLFSEHMPCATLTLISNIFLGDSGTFIAVKNSEESFCERLNELIKTNKPSENIQNHQIEESIHEPVLA